MQCAYCAYAILVHFEQLSGLNDINRKQENIYDIAVPFKLIDLILMRTTWKQILISFDVHCTGNEFDRRPPKLLRNCSKPLFIQKRVLYTVREHRPMHLPKIRMMVFNGTRWIRYIELYVFKDEYDTCSCTSLFLQVVHKNTWFFLLT